MLNVQSLWNVHTCLARLTLRIAAADDVCRCVDRGFSMSNYHFVFVRFDGRILSISPRFVASHLLTYVSIDSMCHESFAWNNAGSCTARWLMTSLKIQERCEETHTIRVLSRLTSLLSGLLQLLLGSPSDCAHLITSWIIRQRGLDLPDSGYEVVDTVRAPKACLRTTKCEAMRLKSRLEKCLQVHWVSPVRGSEERQSNERWSFMLCLHEGKWLINSCFESCLRMVFGDRVVLAKSANKMSRSNILMVFSCAPLNICFADENCIT